MTVINKGEIERLKEKAKIIRCDIVKTISNAQVGHPGGSL